MARTLEVKRENRKYELEVLHSWGSNRMSEVHQLLDMNTGEVFDIPADLSECVIRTKKQLEGYKKSNERFNNPFYWINIQEVKNLNIPRLIKEDKEVSLSVFGALLILSCHIYGEDVLLCKKGNTEKTLTRKEIQKILRLKDWTYAKFLSVMRRYELLHEEKGVCRLNKSYIFVGKNENANICARGYRRGMGYLKSCNLDLAQIGFLFLIIPYLSYKDCKLVSHEGDILLQKDLERLLGLSKVTIRRYLEAEFVYRKSSMSEGVRLKLFMKQSRDGIYVNPMIIRRSSGLKGEIRLNDIPLGFFVDERDRLLHENYRKGIENCIDENCCIA